MRLKLNNVSILFHTGPTSCIFLLWFRGYKLSDIMSHFLPSSSQPFSNGLSLFLELIFFFKGVIYGMSCSILLNCKETILNNLSFDVICIN
jgi:p-aminobenzoyl-glutamate transporter AbgT